MFDYDGPQNHDSSIAIHEAFKENMNDQADDAFEGQTNRRSRTAYSTDSRTFLEIIRKKKKRKVAEAKNV